MGFDGKVELEISTIDQVNEFQGIAHFKFVKVGSQYRFASTDANWLVKHSDMIEVDEKEEVEAAGTIYIEYGKWKWVDRLSATLQRRGVKNYEVGAAVEAELESLIKHEYDGTI